MPDTNVVDTPVIDLVHPMPGFPDERRFGLLRLDDEGTLCALRSLSNPDLRFLVVPPAPFYPDYAPAIDDATVSDLAIASAEEVQLLLILNPGDTLADTTANLRAPIVLNTRTRRATQVILDDAGLSVSTPLLGAE